MLTSTVFHLLSISLILPVQEENRLDEVDAIDRETLVAFLNKDPGIFNLRLM